MATKAIDAPALRGGAKTNPRRIRKIFGNIHEISEMPNLIEVQRESYEQFLRSDPADRLCLGPREDAALGLPDRRISPAPRTSISIATSSKHPKYDTDECRQRGLTYAAPMRVTLRLTTFEIDPDTEAKSVIDIKEQDVYMGDMPLMTMNGTFIINGTERVIVSQMHRSPGVLFDHDRGKTHASANILFAARVIPYRGSWLDFEFDAKDIVNVRIDRKRKLPVTALLHALGLTSEEILNTLLQPRQLCPRQERLADPLRRRTVARPEADPRRGRRRHRRGRLQGQREDHAAPRQPGGQGRPQEPHHPDRGNLRPLLGL